MARSGERSGKPHQLRIIGGKWRGRKLAFTPAEGLRPTADRVRESLFNWLAPHIQDARCADLFAGSGALGLEALSRGAAHCDFVDTSAAALAQVGDHLATLNASANGKCHLAPAVQFLRAASEPYDIVFIDPPFNRQLVTPTCAVLAEKQLLGAGALAYIETATTEPFPEVPPGWAIHRDKAAGGVAYRLFTSGHAQDGR